jgi:hypothetical protein
MTRVKSKALKSYHSSLLGRVRVTEDLELSTGNYQIIKFLVLDASQNIIYAVPLEGSELAKYVTDPFDIYGTQTVHECHDSSYMLREKK